MSVQQVIRLEEGSVERYRSHILFAVRGAEHPFGFGHRYRVTTRDRRPGALEERTCFSIDGNRVYAEGQSSTKTKTTFQAVESTGSWIMDCGESRVANEVVGGLDQRHHRPRRIFIGLEARRGTAATTR